MLPYPDQLIGCCCFGDHAAGVDSMRGTLPWIAPEIIKSPGNVTEAVRPSLCIAAQQHVWLEQYSAIHQSSCSVRVADVFAGYGAGRCRCRQHKHCMLEC
jgi:hypothetical protein